MIRLPFLELQLDLADEGRARVATGVKNRNGHLDCLTGRRSRGTDDVQARGRTRNDVDLGRIGDNPADAVAIAVHHHPQPLAPVGIPVDTHTKAARAEVDLNLLAGFETAAADLYTE
jgi:hypothetical protein